MKKKLFTALFVVTFFSLSAASASAVVNDRVKVGLWFGSNALFSANLENSLGEGFAFGWFDEDREFCSLGWTDETQISMTAAGDIYMNGGGAYSPDIPSGGYRFLGGWHVELRNFRDYDDAAQTARACGGYPAWISGEFVVRVGSYSTRGEAEADVDRFGGDGVAQSSSTGVVVTVTKTDQILFEFDCGGSRNLGVQPDGWNGETSTWFKGYKYAGGFEYARITGGNINVINVVDVEDYVKGVIPYEMNGDWPLAALEAQAVCARTFVYGAGKHTSLYGFDVCGGSDCQVYHGLGSGGAGPSSRSNEAVDNTAGECLYYRGELVKDAVYHSSNGGATEDSANVFGGETGYLTGKADPYESQINIPNYSYSVTYSADELSWILEQKGYSIGAVQNVYISQYTPMGNVKQVTFEGSRGSVTVTGDTCRTVFYSSTYNKSVRSMRFDINGSSAGTGSGVYASSGRQLTSLSGASVISGGGTTETLSGNSASVISSSGVTTVSGGGGTAARPPSGSANGSFTITGTGNGHNVGMSQYGARAMAEQGYTYQDILQFYYTDITIR